MPELLEEMTAWLGYEDREVPSYVWASVLFVFGVSGAIFWPTNTEAAAASVGGLGLLPFWAIGLACGTGQMVTFGLANIFGGTLMERWEWVSKKAHATKRKLGERLDHSYLSLSLLASLIGLPPLWAMVLMGDSFEVNRKKLLSICLMGRIIRFSVLGLVGDQLASLIT